MRSIYVQCIMLGSQGPVQTATPDKFENATLFLRLGLPPALRFSVDEKRFVNGTLRKRSPKQIKLKIQARRGV